MDAVTLREWVTSIVSHPDYLPMLGCIWAVLILLNLNWSELLEKEFDQAKHLAKVLERSSWRAPVKGPSTGAFLVYNYALIGAFVAVVTSMAFANG